MSIYKSQNKTVNIARKRRGIIQEIEGQPRPADAKG